MLMKVVGELENLETVLGQADQTAIAPASVADWCMILAKSPQEQQARDSLRRMGVGAWWPNYKREVASIDRQTGKRYTRLVLSGILPGVILSPARADDRFWHAIDRAPGVMNVVRKASGDFLLLDDLDIVIIHKIESGQNRAVTSAEKAHTFKKGDKVKFVDDILGRFPAGFVEKCRRDGHIEVDVNMMGCVRTVTVLAFQLEFA
jgi:transcription antitermination factor NusG